MFGIHTVGIDLKDACNPDPLKMGSGKLKNISPKYNKLVDITKRKQTHKCREQSSDYRRERGEGGAVYWRGGGRYKEATRMYCPTWGAEPIFYNKTKWSVIFTTCESLYCTPVSHIILYINCTSIFKDFFK